MKFTRQFAESERVGDLDRRILESERDGILAWAVEGCLSWQKTGLRTPASVKAASEKYRSDTDQMGEWLDTCCTRQPDARTTVAALFDSYCEFLRQGGMRPPTKPVFSRQLEQRGFIASRTKTARSFEGLALIVEQGWAEGACGEL